MIYRFGDHRLDPDRAELSGSDGAVAMEPKAFPLLPLLDAAVGQCFTTLPFTDPATRRTLRDALVAAGLPEGARGQARTR